ncbi:hypothetical protein DMA15_03605 [Streptomyces sp. WAC 01529]|uniref:phage fiber-tail adaptor protein n=1 Tax=Streptomyces sp. WAC 01529 TaxID=2203205 RepID=UPI000F71E2E8|nr:hypothetical protein [Streptomyces sp. WAC 01529]AZM51779.1 hypothetical protein DMA15_03605 [Streptomyces sp. WAC 01529]
MTTSTWEKDPDATLDWVWDWSDWLEPGETITTSTMTVSAGLTLNSDAHSATSATAWVSGGTPGTPYQVTNRIITSAGRIDDRSITIRVKNR